MKIKILVVALASLLIAPLFNALPAHAIPPACNINAQLWVNATDGSPTVWGRIRWCTVNDHGIIYPLIQIDDTLTDTYRVHAEFQDSFTQIFHATGNGVACDDVESAGPIVTSCWNASTWAYPQGIGNHLWMRLVRGRTGISGGGSHQDTAHWEWPLNGGWAVIIPD